MKVSHLEFAEMIRDVSEKCLALLADMNGVKRDPAEEPIAGVEYRIGAAVACIGVTGQLLDCARDGAVFAKSILDEREQDGKEQASHGE